MKYLKTLIITALFTPMFVFAAGDEFVSFIGVFQGLLRDMVPIVTGVAVIIFLYGVVKYVKSADQPEERAEGRKIIAYCIISIFVMVSLWGLVNVVVGTVFSDSRDKILDDVPKSEDNVW